MVFLKSAWNSPATSLDLAAKDDQFALRICAVDLKNGPLAAGALIKIKTCLAVAKIPVEVADIKVEPFRDGAKATLQGNSVVAKLLPKAPKMLHLVCSDPDTFLTWMRSAESRRKVPTRCAPGFRSSRSTARRSFRWRLSARRCA